MRTTRIIACLIALALTAPAAARAQQSAVAPEGATLSAEQGQDVRDARDRLHLLLIRPDVRRTARDRGIDLARIHEGIETMGPVALATVAPYADEVEETEAESAITISTTTIIISLLVIIIVVLIA